MAKAHITTKDGMTIDLEGTAEEVVALVEKFALLGNASSQTGAGEAPQIKRTSEAPAKPAAANKSGRKSKSRKAGVQAVIAEMIGERYFKQPKFLGAVRADLEQAAHFYDRMAVGKALERAVKSKQLRRMKKEGKWAYVG